MGDPWESAYGDAASRREQEAAASRREQEAAGLLQHVSIPSKATIDKMTSIPDLQNKLRELDRVREAEYDRSTPKAGVRGIIKFLKESIWEGSTFYDITATDPLAWMPLGPNKYTTLYKQIVTAMANINLRIQQIEYENRQRSGDLDTAYQQSGSAETKEQYTQRQEGLAYLQRMTPQQLIKWFIQQDEYLDTPIQTKVRPDIVDVDEDGKPIYAEDTKAVEAREQENRERVLQLGIAVLEWLGSDKSRKRNFKMELRKWGKTTEGRLFQKKYSGVDK